jgi:hypothetical protein
MNFSMTIDHATVSTMAKDEYEMLRHIEACFLAAGYDSDTFAEYLAHYLELYHEMTVLPEKEYTQALNEAREEAYGEGRADREDEEEDEEESDEEESDEEESDEEDEDEKDMASSVAYDIGWNDGNTGEDVDKEYEHDRVYMWGYKNGRGQRIAAMK